MWHHVTQKWHTFELLLHQRGVLVEHASHTNSINVYDQRPNRKKRRLHNTPNHFPNRFSYLFSSAKNLESILVIYLGLVQLKSKIRFIRFKHFWDDRKHPTFTRQSSLDFVSYFERFRPFSPVFGCSYGILNRWNPVKMTNLAKNGIQSLIKVSYFLLIHKFLESNSDTKPWP